MSEHALLSPSSWERIYACFGSVLLTKDLPDTESEYAAEGTAAHKLAAFALETKRDWPLPEEFEAVQAYVDEIRNLSKGQSLFIEDRVPIGHITLENGAEGTADAIFISEDGKTLSISDLKYGQGVRVSAVNNKQEMLYALGAVHKYAVVCDPERIILRIHQPRLNHLDEWECSREELEDFGQSITVVARQVWNLLDGKIKFDPEKHLNPT